MPDIISANHRRAQSTYCTQETFLEGGLESARDFRPAPEFLNVGTALDRTRISPARKGGDCSFYILELYWTGPYQGTTSVVPMDADPFPELK